MSTPDYTSPYPQIVGFVPDDLEDKGTPGTGGGYTASQLAAKHAADQEATNRAAAATATSCFDDGTPITGGQNGPTA